MLGGDYLNSLNEDATTNVKDEQHHTRPYHNVRQLNEPQTRTPVISTNTIGQT